MSNLAEVTLLRTRYESDKTIGYIRQGARTYISLERPWKNNAQGVSCIPCGRYLVTWTMSPRFKRCTYEVQKVPHRSGIRIHPANYASQLEGCIALGISLIPGGIGSSRVAVTAFESDMQRGSFWLTIKDSQDCIREV